MNKFPKTEVTYAILVALGLAGAGDVGAAAPVGASVNGIDNGRLTVDTQFGLPASRAGDVAKTTSGAVVNPTASYTIDAAQYGVFSLPNKNNVFFGFSKFLIDRNETATFTCAACPGTNNVIARVNSNPAEIYGNLTSTIKNTTTDIGAAFYLLSNEGVIIGKNATLNLPGALHVGATNTLSFSDGTKLPAGNSDASTLDANPQDFGFLSGAGTGKVTLGADDRPSKSASTLTIQSVGITEISGNTVEIVPSAAGDSLQVSAQTTGSSLDIKAGGADSGTTSALRVGTGSTVSNSAGNINMETDNAAGSITVESGATVNNAFLVKAASSSVTIAGEVATDSAVAGKDIEVTGKLTVGNVTADQNVTVQGAAAKLTAKDSVTATNDQVSITGGGTLENSGNLTVKGASVLVKDADSNITDTNAGTLAVEATTGTVDIGQGASIQGATQVQSDASDVVIAGTVGADKVTAGQNVTVQGVAAKLTAKESATAKNQVSITGGGTLENSGDLTVEGASVQVDNLSQIKGTTLGTMTVRANADNSRVTVNGGGTILGAVGKGLTVEATGNNGSVFIAAGGSIKDPLLLRAVSGDVTIDGSISTSAKGNTNTSISAGNNLTLGTLASIAINHGGAADVWAGNSIIVDGGSITAANGNKSALNVGLGQGANAGTKLVSVTNGGVVRKATGGDMAVQAGRVLLDNGKIEHGGDGTLTVKATGNDNIPAGELALDIRNNGQIRQTGSAGNLLIDSHGSLKASSLDGLFFKGTDGDVTLNAGKTFTALGNVQYANNGKFTVTAGAVDIWAGGSIGSSGKGDFSVTATGLDGANRDINGIVLASALTVKANGQIQAINTGNATVEATNASGSVAVAGKLSLDNTGVGSVSAGRDVNVLGTVGSATVTAGHDVTVSGNLTASVTSAGHDITVDGAAANLTGVTSASAVNQILVTNGGVVRKATGGDMAVQAGRVLLDNGKIEHGGGGTLTVKATGDDPDPFNANPNQRAYALDIRNGGQIRQHGQPVDRQPWLVEDKQPGRPFLQRHRRGCHAQRWQDLHGARQCPIHQQWEVHRHSGRGGHLGRRQHRVQRQG